jgi:hypothetical protein
LQHTARQTAAAPCVAFRGRGFWQHLLSAVTRSATTYKTRLFTPFAFGPSPSYYGL